MGWKIIKDNLDNQGWSHYKSLVGKERNYKGGTYQVRTFDDDDILYYTALCDGEVSAEAFHDWSMYDSGSVRSQVREKGNQKWQEFIS